MDDRRKTYITTYLEKWLVENPGHQLIVETYSHPPTSWSHGGTEWIARMDDADGLVLADGAGLIMTHALEDLAGELQAWVIAHTKASKPIVWKDID